MNSKNKVEVENINTPGRTTNVDAIKYYEMKTAFLKLLPDSSPGLTQKEIQEQIKQFLSQDIFPEGKTSGWWAKTVQLDLEAKGVVVRENVKPLRWYRLWFITSQLTKSLNFLSYWGLNTKWLNQQITTTHLLR